MTSPLDQAQINPPGGRRQRIPTTFETQPEEIVATVDGFIRRSKTLKLILDDGSYQTAEVRDPSFDVEPNIYIEALGSGDPLKLTIRTALRSGKVYKIYVLEAKRPS